MERPVSQTSNTLNPHRFLYIFFTICSTSYLQFQSDLCVFRHNKELREQKAKEELVGGVIQDVIEALYGDL